MVDRVKNFLKKVFIRVFRKVECWNREYDLMLLRNSFKSCGEDFYAHSPYKIHGTKEIVIGNNVKLGSYLQIWGEGGITIGDDCLIASHVSINSVTHNTQTKTFNEQNLKAPIKIGDNVWIGSHAILVPGVQIGNNCVIGAGSFVNSNIPDNSIAVGTPAKVIKKVDNNS
jgi:acetyltransferase-like isoleucine patch superfamily enzyme